MRLRYKTRVGMTAAPAATSSVRDPRLGSRAGCGCCWRSWSSPPPRPRPAQVNEGFGPGAPRWPLSGPSALRPRGRPAPRLRPPEMRRRVRPGGAGAGEPAQGLGARGPPPGAVRAAGKDVPLGGPAHASASHPFWRVTPLLVLLGLSWVAVRPAGAQCLVANPGSDQGQTNWVPWGPGIATLRPDSLPPGGCQHPSPPAPCMESGGGHPETRGPGQAGLSGQGDFRLKINCEAELLIIRLGGRWQERGVNI